MKIYLEEVVHWINVHVPGDLGGHKTLIYSIIYCFATFSLH